MLVNAPLICHVEMTRLNTGFWLGVYTFLPERAKKKDRETSNMAVRFTSTFDIPCPIFNIQQRLLKQPE